MSDPPDSKQLTTIYKKNGQFDSQRKTLLENFKQSETYSNLLLKLKILIENKIKQDPTILTKNKGKMAALIQGEIINESNGLLSIVDKDIQDKIIDSPQFHNLIREQLLDIQRVLLGISDEEFAKQKEQEKLRMERLKLEAKFANSNSDYKNNFRVKSLTTSHRITKPPRFNIHTNTSSSNQLSSKDKDKKVPFMMY